MGHGPLGRQGRPGNESIRHTPSSIDRLIKIPTVSEPRSSCRTASTGSTSISGSVCGASGASTGGVSRLFSSRSRLPSPLTRKAARYGILVVSSVGSSCSSQASASAVHEARRGLRSQRCFHRSSRCCLGLGGDRASQRLSFGEPSFRSGFRQPIPAGLANCSVSVSLLSVFGGKSASAAQLPALPESQGWAMAPGCSPRQAGSGRCLPGGNATCYGSSQRRGSPLHQSIPLPPPRFQADVGGIRRSHLDFGPNRRLLTAFFWAYQQTLPAPCLAARLSSQARQHPGPPGWRVEYDLPEATSSQERQARRPALKLRQGSPRSQAGWLCLPQISALRPAHAAS
jgi:hypothetical protein